MSFAKTKILGKYNIQYFQCRNCQFVQTEDPYWLEETYVEAINDSDIGLIGRNIFLSRISQAVILTFFDGNAKFVDYGGGYGLFVRLMRDAGFDFYRFDQFCANLFVKGFEANLEYQNQYELVTAFELFEHLIQPLDEIEKMLKFSKNIFFSTNLIPSNNPKPDEWWYYGLEHGQHISLYTRKSLAIIANEFHLNLYSHGNSLHLLTPERIPSFLFTAVLRYKIATLLIPLLRKKLKKKSLLADDYFKTTGKYLR